MKSKKIIENRGKSLKIDEKLMKIVENRCSFCEKRHKSSKIAEKTKEKQKKRWKNEKKEKEIRKIRKIRKRKKNEKINIYIFVYIWICISS